MTRESKRAARWFAVACWVVSGVTIFLTPLAIISIPVAIIVLVVRAAGARRAAQIKPTPFHYNHPGDVPIELRGGMH